MERFATPFPGRIHRLGELATDVWWSWQLGARALFRRLDLAAWRTTAHNPARMLRTLGTDVLQSAADDPEFLRLYDAAVAGLDAARHPTSVVVAAAERPGRGWRHRLLLGGVRPPPVAADLRRRARRAGRRPLQGGQRPRRAAGRRRLHVSAGLFPPARDRRRLAAGALRADQLGRCPDRDGDHRRWPAVHHGGAARRSHGARRRVAGQGRPCPALPARHRSRGERPMGSRAVGAALRRRSRDAHPAGGHPRHRRRARVACAGYRAGGVAPQRRPRRVRGAATDPRAHRARTLIRRGSGVGPPHDRVHDAHPGARRPRRLPFPPRGEAPGRLLGRAGSAPGAIPRPR